MDSESKSLKQVFFSVGDMVLGAGILVALGVWSGNFLDAKLNTSPWFTIGLALAGATAGLVRMVLKAMSMDKDKPDKDQDKSSSLK